MKQDNEQLLRDYIGILWRQKIWILIPTIAGILVSIFLVLYLPKIYRSTTLILVEAQKVPEEYVKSAVSGTVEGRLSTIQQQILSRSLLQKIIDRFDLYQREQKGTAVEEIIERMRGNIEVKTVGTRNNIDAFSISYEGKDPMTVMKVTNELASLFIEENLKIREQLVEGTSEFLDNELSNLKTILEEQENKIGEFKRAYMGELPQQLEPNLRALDRFQADLQSIQLSKKMAEDRKLTVEKTIEIMKQQMAGINDPNSPQNLGSETGLSPLMLKLSQRREILASLQMEYKESYPDIIMLKREIQEIENQIGLAESGNPLQEGGRESAGKVFQLAPGYLADLQKQLRETEIELRGLRNREKAIEKQIKVYEHRVENVPAREQILLTLVRDYDNTKKNYEALLDKKLSAKISENLEKRQKGEQFRILDAANLPERPFKPDRVKIGLAGLLLGLGGGLALAFFREQLDSSIRKPEEVERVTSVPVLVSIPDFTEEMRGFEKRAKKTIVENKTSKEEAHGA